MTSSAVQVAEWMALVTGIDSETPQDRPDQRITRRNCDGIRSSRPSLRIRRARASHRRGDDAGPPRQAPPGLRRQGERRPRGHRVGRRRRPRRPQVARQPAGRQAGPGPQQRGRPRQPHVLLDHDEPGRRRRAERSARGGDRLDVRQPRRAQGEGQGGRRRSVRLGLGLAGPRRRRAEGHLDRQPGLTRLQRPDAAAGRRRLGARLLPQVPEQAPRLPGRLLERRRLERSRHPLRRSRRNASRGRPLSRTQEGRHPWRPFQRPPRPRFRT